MHTQRQALCFYLNARSADRRASNSRDQLSWSCEERALNGIQFAKMKTRGPLLEFVARALYGRIFLARDYLPVVAQCVLLLNKGQLRVQKWELLIMITKQHVAWDTAAITRQKELNLQVHPFCWRPSFFYFCLWRKHITEIRCCVHSEKAIVHLSLNLRCWFSTI